MHQSHFSKHGQINCSRAIQALKHWGAIVKAKTYVPISRSLGYIQLRNHLDDSLKFNSLWTDWLITTSTKERVKGMGWEGPGMRFSQTEPGVLFCTVVPGQPQLWGLSVRLSTQVIWGRCSFLSLLANSPEPLGNWQMFPDSLLCV